jgi:hypothetical protein
MQLRNIIPLPLLIFSFFALSAQEAGLKTISSAELKAHIEFLASDELEGRGNGEPGLSAAAEYLADQAGRSGLTPIDKNKDYIQEYTLYKNTYVPGENHITISYNGKEEVIANRDFYMIVPRESDGLNLTGEIVFAGYGIRSDSNRYDDFANIDIKDKIVLIMNRAPMSEDGSYCLFDDLDWTSDQNIIYKYFYLYLLQPKAVLLVLDPKSGYSSLTDIDPSLPEMFSTFYTSGDPAKPDNRKDGMITRVIMIHRDIADKILEDTGSSLSELQYRIDRALTPHSFPVRNKIISIKLEVSNDKLDMPNVTGLVKGSDPELDDEQVILMAHFDHLGKDETGNIYKGADDNASGSSALLEMAEAFMEEDNKPARSILFLWVSGEEIGLFGSMHYAEHPLLPLENTVAVINLDMVGRIRTPADTGMILGDQVDVMGPDTLGIIGGHQSKELLSVAESVARECSIIFDNSYNDINHPQRLYYRSDHFSFVMHDIPILFFSTGIHRDYHQITDTPEKIDYERLEQVSRFVYTLSFRLADRQERIIVDNPFSTWQPEP